MSELDASLNRAMICFSVALPFSWTYAMFLRHVSAGGWSTRPSRIFSVVVGLPTYLSVWAGVALILDAGRTNSGRIQYSLMVIRKRMMPTTTNAVVIMVDPRFFSPLMKKANAPIMSPNTGANMDIIMSIVVAFSNRFFSSGITLPFSPMDSGALFKRTT